MSKGTAIIGMLVALVVGVFIGQTWNKGSGSSGPVPTAALPDSSVERFKVPVGNAPTKGPEHAKVTIVEWSDFQCPFCSRVEPTIEQIMKTYGKDVRIVWKNQPLPFHQNAKPAAEAAMAANAKQGKPSGRSTTSCSTTSRRSIARRSRSTPRSSASTTATSRPRSTAASTAADRRPTRRGQRVRRPRYAVVLHQRPPVRRARSPSSRSRG